MIAPPKPPSHDELEALIKEARARQLRRRLLGAAGIAIAAAVGLAVYALTSGGGFLSTNGDSLGLDGAPNCRSSRLKTEPVFFEGVPGARAGVGITNASAAACSLPSGIPHIRLFWHGQRLAVRQIRVAHPFRQAGEPVVHVLRPGKSAQIDFDWRNWCGRPKLSNYPRDFPTLRFEFRGGLASGPGSG